MKKVVAFIVINLTFILNIIGQENIDLRDLKTPSSPGFQIEKAFLLGATKEVVKLKTSVL